MADYKIVKGLPLPPEKQGKRISSIVRKLEVGDCAQFPGALPNSVNSTAGRILGKDAAHVTKEERQAEGKVPELSCGYGGALGAFRKMGGAKVDAMDDERIIAIVKQWRAAHPATVKFWYAIERAVRDALRSEGDSFVVRDIVADTKRDAHGNLWLRIRLPSGAYLCYLRPEITSDECYTCDGTGQVRWEGKDYACHECNGSGKNIRGGQITYEGIDQYTRQWKRIKTYGGKLAENFTQAFARDVMAWNMPAIEDAGYEIVLTVHDEVVTETPDSEDFNAEQLSAMLATNPPWSDGLPLAAAGFEAYRYRKD